MNAFEDLAERQISAPRKARLRAAEKRGERRAAERKAAKERQQLNAVWRRWRNEQREKAASWFLRRPIPQPDRLSRRHEPARWRRPYRHGRSRVEAC